MPEYIQKSNTSYSRRFLMVDSTDHRTGKPGLTPAMMLWKEGAGAAIAATGAISELSWGLYEWHPSITDADTLGSLVGHITADGADPVDIEWEVVAYDPTLSPVTQYDALTEGDLVLEVRYALGDYGIYRSHIVPVGIINGTNKRYQSALMPLGGGAKVYDSAGTEKTTGFSLDIDTGMLVYTVAPTIGASHFIEGNVYRYRTLTIQQAIGAAGRALYGVWGTSKYVVSGTGLNLSLSPDPAGLDREIIIVASALKVLTGRQSQAASDAMSLSDAVGSMNIAPRAPQLQALREDLRKELSRLCSVGGYYMPRFAAIDYPDDFMGQSWFAEDEGEIS